MMDSSAIESILGDVPSPPNRETDVDRDGWIYDVATGEVLGHSNVDGRFRVDCEEAADWVLEVRSQIEGEIVALEARLRAVTERIQDLKRVQMRRLSWWEWRFAPSLTDFARRVLQGKKSRTARFAWGSVSFRKSSGITQIADMDRAVDFVSQFAPDRIRTVRTVTVKDLLTTMEEIACLVGETIDEGGLLLRSGPQESVRISTGVMTPAPTTTKGADDE